MKWHLHFSTIERSLTTRPFLKCLFSRSLANFDAASARYDRFLLEWNVLLCLIILLCRWLLKSPRKQKWGRHTKFVLTLDLFDSFPNAGILIWIFFRILRVVASSRYLGGKSLSSISTAWDHWSRRLEPQSPQSRPFYPRPECVSGKRPVWRWNGLAFRASFFRMIIIINLFSCDEAPNFYTADSSWL